jgi:hypothetical protein
MPSFMLKKIVLGNFSSGPVDPMMADAIDFMVDRVRMVALAWEHLVLGNFHITSKKIHCSYFY